MTMMIMVMKMILEMIFMMATVVMVTADRLTKRV